MFAALLPMLLLASPAQASLLKPDSTEGRQLVHRLAEEVSYVFVNQSNFLSGASTDAELTEEAVRAACESSRTAILTELGSLDLKGSSELLTAQAALEKAVCTSTAAAEGAPSPIADLRKAHDAFFTATIFLRASDALN